MTFDIFGQIKNELQEYHETSVHIAGTIQSDDAKYLSKKNDWLRFFPVANTQYN